MGNSNNKIATQLPATNIPQYWRGWKARHMFLALHTKKPLLLEGNYLIRGAQRDRRLNFELAVYVCTALRRLFTGEFLLYELISGPVRIQTGRNARLSRCLQFYTHEGTLTN